MSYLPEVNKYGDLGLQLNLPVDLVSKAAYSRLTNCVPRQEGTLQTREGITKVADIVAATPIHSIFRLNQQVPTVFGERLVGIGSSLYTAPLPNGNAFVQLSGIVYDGSPLSIVPFRFDADPQAWAIIADGAQMMKRKQGYYQFLGLAPPIDEAISTSDGAGLLDSTNGTGYDWRYTYVNPVVNSESNPSPIQAAAQGGGGGGTSNEVLRPAGFTNPIPVVPGFPQVPSGGAGMFPYLNPANAFDLNPTTFASITLSEQQAGDCSWEQIPAASFPYFSLTLFITSEVLATTGTASWATYLDYSTDGGITWNNIYTVAFDRTVVVQPFPASRPVTTDQIILSPGTDLTKVRVRGIEAALHKTTPAFTQGAHRVYDIYTVGVPVTPGTFNGGLVLTNEKARVCVTPPTDPQETDIRLYRRGGSLVSNWYNVGQYPVSTLAQGGCGAGKLEIIDNSSDAAITGNPTLELDNDQPVTSINIINQHIGIIWGPFDSRILGCGDPNRPDAVYFSKRGNADEYPPQNWVTVSNPSEPMMNGLVYATRCFAFSTERMFVLVPNIIQGVTFTPFETACRRGLIGRFALCAGASGVYFVSKDGIYVTDGGPEQSVVKNDIRPLFPTQDAPGEDVYGYEAPDMNQTDSLRLCYHNSEIWFGYIGKTSGLQKWLIYDETKQRWRASEHGPLANVVYDEPSTVSSLLIGGVNGSLYQSSGTTDDGTPIAVTLRTGAFDQGLPLKIKEYGDVLFDLDPGGANITITPFLNGDVTSIAPLVITGNGRQTIPLSLSDTLARNVSFGITWSGGTPILYQHTIMYRPSATALRHWEVPPTSFGCPGWLHVRDGYLVVRSNADVTLKITAVDGVLTTNTITLPSTGGAKRKQYWAMTANKGKLYKFEIDSTADMQLFFQESEIRWKPWLTRLGYQVAQILGGEAPPPMVE